MAYVLRDDQVRDDDQPAGARPRRRTRNQGRRGRTVRFALTDQEYAELSAAARHAGLARGAFAAEAALSVARGVVVTPDAPLRDAFYALDRAALLVRRIGVNLNQAVAKLNATGQWSGDLVSYAEESIRRAARLEAAGEDLRKRFLRAIRAPGPRGPELYGPGRREEHTDPHIIAGYRPPGDLEPPLRANGTRDFRRLVGLLRLPHDALGKWGYAKPVWHCSMRAAPEDRLLSDAEWAGIARDVMYRTGLCPRGEEDHAVRWIAIRHGPDHIHLVAMLARQDRTRPRIVNERYRVRDACLAAERRYGLRSTAPADRTAARRPTRAETGKAARHGRGEPSRITLRRHVSTAAASAASTEEFFARLDQAGVLVRLRYSVKNPVQVTGYAVALSGDTTKDGERVWYGGGKLAADLSWPKLRQRWTRPARPDSPLTPDEADALWEYASRTAADATARIRFYTATGNPAAAADAACAASDALHTAAAALGSRPCAGLPTTTTAPPASPTGGYPARSRQGTSSVTPPG